MIVPDRIEGRTTDNSSRDKLGKLDDGFFSTRGDVHVGGTNAASIVTLDCCKRE